MYVPNHCEMSHITQTKHDEKQESGSLTGQILRKNNILKQGNSLDTVFTKIQWRGIFIIYQKKLQCSDNQKTQVNWANSCPTLILNIALTAQTLMHKSSDKGKGNLATFLEEKIFRNQETLMLMQFHDLSSISVMKQFHN